ncbi:hypothetical protein LK533_04105 [Sphingomonas sp. PL-96]|uniref:DUF6975 family protein n=1 Tax=Sphingomonas sp. PL-96 TaxID=2887201 RepID=UPI001E35E852|nr:hypothetical protein [Sphingomonas sp. PL-96]MCC2975859.1 hypothetical protein [Sphingomonas sp. PL-96]
MGGVISAAAPDAWSAVRSLAERDGSATRPQLTALANKNCDRRDVADAAHYLAILHGRMPGVIEHAGEHSDFDAAQGWLTEAAACFAQERSYLVALSAAAGAVPSTPGQAATEAAIAAQRHAIDMLSESERRGCALGAAIALVCDWPAVRTALDASAERLELAPPPLMLPNLAATAELVTTLAASRAVERAMLFGIEQLLAQHRGLWDLLEARSEARAG